MASSTLPFTQPPLLQGSMWRKWDLHLHAPSSVFNNQFPYVNNEPDWESYLALLNSADVAVLGITDYFSIDGYKQVKAAKDDGKLPNVAMVLPNIEFRLDLLVPTSRQDDNGKVKKINAHVLFAPEVSQTDIEEHFLTQLHFSAKSMPQGPTERWGLSAHQLRQFGMRLKREHNFSGDDYEVGCRNASINFHEIKTVLESRRSVFGQKYFIFLATENTSLINWDGQGHALRKTLLQGSDGVFGNAAERDFYLGHKHANEDEFIQEFGSMKPCVQGSDAHGPDQIGKPVDGRFCWVKADPTFEGFRQIVFEPADRIYLGDQPPQLKHPHRVLRNIRVTSAPDWFSFSPIPLNSDLVTIIGGKGAGKSALSELIAFAGGADVFRGVKPKDLQDTFLAKACKRSPSNLKTIAGATITLTWSDGSETSATVTESLDHGLTEERVKYLPQKFVERMCAPESHADLVREVERVIFHRIAAVDRFGASTFADLRDLKTKKVQVKRLNLIQQLTELNREVYLSFERQNTRADKVRSLDLARKELAELLKSRPDTATASQEELARLAKLQAKQKQLEADDAANQVLLSIVDELEARFSSMEERVVNFNAEVVSLLAKLNLQDESTSLKINVPERARIVLQGKRNNLQQIISAMREKPDEGFNATVAEIKQVAEKLELSRARRTEFEKHEKDRKAVESQITALEKEIAYIDGSLTEELTSKRAQRLEKYLDYFGVLHEEKAALDSLYEPLRSALAGGGETDQKLQFDSKIAFQIETHAANGCELFDNRRRGRFRDKDVLVAELRRWIGELETASFDRDFARTKLVEFRNQFFFDEDGKSVSMREQLKRSKTEEDFNNWFFALEPYSVEYSITFDGRNLALLSPGQKGIVLLLVYLEIDQEDQRPLIIDQPEDNLDNLSVYSNLIQFFRKRKCSRQILLITHNPNLVVNTDSEQIIVATYEGERLPRIAYRSGALEETSNDPPGVRELVCAILEGGREAFRKREAKYALT